MQLPIDFKNAVKEQLGEAYQDFEAALAAPPLVSIRFHVSKKFDSKENYNGVKWHNNGVYLKERPVFTLDPVFQAGAYYVQEASSMFVAEAIRQLIGDQQGGLKVLDLCAAPGGKSTLLLDQLPEGSFLLTNEVIKNRFQVLKYNLIKWGVPSIATTSFDSKYFSALPAFFDLILVDAPCSGEGLFRKDPASILEWSPENVQLCSARQKRILAEAMPLLRPGGHLIYCTCTYNRLENEENAAWITQSGEFRPIPLTIPAEWGIQAKSLGYQFYPHKVKGEGFYIACFQKEGQAQEKTKKQKGQPLHTFKLLSKKERIPLEEWLSPMDELCLFTDQNNTIRAIPAVNLPTAEILKTQLKHLLFGLEIGSFKGKDFVPAPSLALSTIRHPSIPSIALDETQALAYLRKEDLDLPESVKGWHLVTYQGLGLGWIKGLGNRINNYYPKDWRIRMKK